MHGPKCVVETGMQSAWIHHGGKPQLFYTPEPLEVWVFDNIKNQLVGNGDEAVKWVVYDFSLEGWDC